MPISKLALCQWVLGLEHIHSLWTLGALTPGLVLGRPTSLVQILKTQGRKWQYSMGVEVSRERNVC